MFESKYTITENICNFMQYNSSYEKFEISERKISIFRKVESEYTGPQISHDQLGVSINIKDKASNFPQIIIKSPGKESLSNPVKFDNPR